MLSVAGVSFHIGSGARDAFSFADAIAAAREVFDISARMKLHSSMHILDIGGGFTSGSSLKFLDAAAAVNSALDRYFPPEMGVTVIAEPGRYFAETPSTLATTVIGKRVRGDVKEYWINDGIYGSMNCLLYDHAILKYRPLICSPAEESRNNIFHGDCGIWFQRFLNVHNPHLLCLLCQSSRLFSIPWLSKMLAPDLMKGCLPELNMDGNIIESWGINSPAIVVGKFQ
jgi:hypothetical protein